MKQHMQTVINVCLAIFITVFIYRNDKLNDEILDLKIDMEVAKLKISDNKKAVTENYENFLKQDEYNKGVASVVDNNTDNISIAFKNFDIAKNNIGINTTKIDNIEEWIVDNFND